MSIRHLVPIAIMLCVGCASHEGYEKPQPQTVEPETTPTDPPKPARVLAQASIASVQMIEDCPDQDPPPPAATPMPPEKPTAGSMARPMKQPRQPAAGAARESMTADSLGDGFEQPCTQSMMQMAFNGQGDSPGKVRIKSVAMLKPGTDDELGRVTPRAPTAWKNDAYQAWDEVIPAKSDIKASYRISVPDWSALERKLGKGSYGQMFVLEVVLEIDGEEQIVRSPEFPREEPHVIVT